jgi:uncharacterized protein (DUF2384 family)
MSSPEQDSTSAEQMTAQLEHPTASAVWEQALEVFGDHARALSWMETPRGVLDGCSPREWVASGDVTQLRRILEELVRIDYGMFS